MLINKLLCVMSHSSLQPMLLLSGISLFYLAGLYTYQTHSIYRW